MYDYLTPDGYGDTFFVYTVNGEDIPIANGQSYSLLGIPVQDAMFVCRVWTGAMRIIGATGTIQVYDGVKNAWFQLPILQTGNFPPAMAVLPEKVYRDNSALRFDLTNVELAVNSNGMASVYADQMAFIGSKRLLSGPSDPSPSMYKYYEKTFSYPVVVALSNYGPSDGGGNPIAGLAAPTQYTIQIQDYDFELREIIMSATGTGGTGPLIMFNEEGQCLQLSSVGGSSGTFHLNFNGLPNQVLAITVIGTVITVDLGSNAFANVTTTIDDLIALLNTTPASAAIVFATKLFPGGAFGLPSFPSSGTWGAGASTVSPYASPFKILLYDATWRQRSNIPVLAEFICKNVSNVSPVSNTPNNVWPSPPILYPVNSVIRFDIFSLIPTGDTLPVTVSLVFNGVRRIAC
jgi:hypothetical protein